MCCCRLQLLLEVCSTENECHMTDISDKVSGQVTAPRTHDVECLPHYEVWLDHSQRPTQERSREVHAPASEDHNQVLQGTSMFHIPYLCMLSHPISIFKYFWFWHDVSQSDGSSHGVRQFIQQDVVQFAKQNPSTVVYLKPRSHRWAFWLGWWQQQTWSYKFIAGHQC